MAPPPEYDKEPKAPDKSAINISCEEPKTLHNLVIEQQTNSDNKLANTTACGDGENKHVETLDDGQLRALLDEAITYKCPKDREGKSSLFKELLEEVEQDEQACEAAARGSTSRARRQGRGRRALPHSNSLQDLVAALAAEPAPRRVRHQHQQSHAPVSARAIHGGSLPSGVDTSFLLGEEPPRAGYLATVRCVNPPPLAERRVSASDANCPAEVELLNRRSKPVFPMTYTARATLEIGSGAVCSGRALTTTTSSNQVRTRTPSTYPWSHHHANRASYHLDDHTHHPFRTNQVQRIQLRPHKYANRPRYNDTHLPANRVNHADQASHPSNRIRGNNRFQASNASRNNVAGQAFYASNRAGLMHFDDDFSHHLVNSGHRELDLDTDHSPGRGHSIRNLDDFYRKRQDCWASVGQDDFAHHSLNSSYQDWSIDFDQEYDNFHYAPVTIGPPERLYNKPKLFGFKKTLYKPGKFVSIDPTQNFKENSKKSVQKSDKSVKENPACKSKNNLKSEDNKVEKHKQQEENVVATAVSVVKKEKIMEEKIDTNQKLKPNEKNVLATADSVVKKVKLPIMEEKIDTNQMKLLRALIICDTDGDDDESTTGGGIVDDSKTKEIRIDTDKPRGPSEKPERKVYQENVSKKEVCKEKVAPVSKVVYSEKRHGPSEKSNRKINEKNVLKKEVSKEKVAPISTVVHSEQPHGPSENSNRKVNKKNVSNKVVSKEKVEPKSKKDYNENQHGPSEKSIRKVNQENVSKKELYIEKEESISKGVSNEIPEASGVSAQSQIWTENVNNWYESLDTYINPISGPLDNYAASPNKGFEEFDTPEIPFNICHNISDRNIASHQNVYKKLEPSSNSNPYSIQFPFVSRSHMKRKYKYNTESKRQIPYMQDDYSKNKFREHEVERNVTKFCDFESDINDNDVYLLRKKYRERVGNLELPSLSVNNPTNIRKMTIGKPLPKSIEKPVLSKNDKDKPNRKSDDKPDRKNDNDKPDKSDGDKPDRKFGGDKTDKKSDDHKPNKTSDKNRFDQDSNDNKPDRKSDDNKSDKKSEHEKSNRTSHKDKPDHKFNDDNPDGKSDDDKPDKKPNEDKPDKKSDDKPDKKSDGDKPDRKSDDDDKPDKKFDDEKPDKSSDKDRSDQNSNDDKPDRKSDDDKPNRTSDKDTPDQKSDDDHPDGKSHEPDMKPNEDKPDRKSDDKPDKKLDDDKADKKSDGDKPDRKSDDDKPDKKLDDDKPDKKSDDDKHNTKTDDDKPIKTSDKDRSDQNSNDEKPDRKSDDDKPNRSSDKYKPDQKSDDDKPNGKSDDHKPDWKSDDDKPDKKTDGDTTDRKPDDYKPDKKLDHVKSDEKSDDDKHNTKPNDNKPNKTSDKGRSDQNSNGNKPDKKSDDDKSDQKSDDDKPNRTSDKGKPDQKSDFDKPYGKSDDDKPDTKSNDNELDWKSNDDKPDRKPGEDKPDRKSGDDKPSRKSFQDQPDGKIDDDKSDEHAPNQKSDGDKFDGINHNKPEQKSNQKDDGKSGATSPKSYHKDKADKKSNVDDKLRDVSVKSICDSEEDSDTNRNVYDRKSDLNLINNKSNPNSVDNILNCDSDKDNIILRVCDNIFDENKFNCNTCEGLNGESHEYKFHSNLKEDESNNNTLEDPTNRNLGKNKKKSNCYLDGDKSIQEPDEVIYEREQSIRKSKNGTICNSFVNKFKHHADEDKKSNGNSDIDILTRSCDEYRSDEQQIDRNTRESKSNLSYEEGCQRNSEQNKTDVVKSYSTNIDNISNLSSDREKIIFKTDDGNYTHLCDEDNPKMYDSKNDNKAILKSDYYQNCVEQYGENEPEIQFYTDQIDNGKLKQTCDDIIDTSNGHSLQMPKDNSDTQIVLQLNKTVTENNKIILAKLPNNAYILTFPNRFITPHHALLPNDNSAQGVSAKSEHEGLETMNKNAFKMLLFKSLFRSDCEIETPVVKAVVKEVDSAIPFSCITTPEVVASCNTTSSTSQAAVVVDPKPLQLVSSYRAVASLVGAPYEDEASPSRHQHDPRSVISSSFNGLPLSRPNYGSTASSAPDEYKKSLDENGNSVQGFSSPFSGSSQHKKPRRKKSTKNETVIKSHQIDGYQGNKDLNEVLRFIESNADNGRAHKLGRAKHKDDSDDKGKKRSTERRKDKESKIKRATSMEELSRTKLEDLTDKPAKKERGEAKAERRSWGDDTRDSFYYEPEPEVVSGREADFQTVTKKRRPRRRADEPAPSPSQRAPSPRARRVSAPPSDRSNDSNDDLDSVHSLHSLPADVAPNRLPHAPASYADIARTRHNIPDLIESCNFYLEQREAAAGGVGGTGVPPGDADGYPALEPRAPPPRRTALPRDAKPVASPLQCTRDRKERSESTVAAEGPAPDVVSDRRPPVILLDSTQSRDMDGITFGFDINEQLLGGPSQRPRCDLVRSALEGSAAGEAVVAAGAVAVRAGCAAIRYVPPDAPPDDHHLHLIVDYVTAAWEDVVRCGGGKVRYYSE